MANHYPSLNAKKALIWRIVHRDNLPWIFASGRYSGNGGAVAGPHWTQRLRQGKAGPA